MLPGRILNQGRLALESDALPTATRGPAGENYDWRLVENLELSKISFCFQSLSCFLSHIKDLVCCMISNWVAGTHFLFQCILSIQIRSDKDFQNLNKCMRDFRLCLYLVGLGLMICLW